MRYLLIAHWIDIRCSYGLWFVTCAGVREKQIAFLKVKVYAVGVYAEAQVRASLNSWKGKSAAELATDDAVYKELADGFSSILCSHLLMFLSRAIRHNGLYVRQVANARGILSSLHKLT